MKCVGKLLLILVLTKTVFPWKNLTVHCRYSSIKLLDTLEDKELLLSFLLTKGNVMHTDVKSGSKKDILALVFSLH